MLDLDLKRLHEAQQMAVQMFARQPKDHSGRGIVTTVFDREFASCWVLLSELKRLNVSLPIEGFHRPGELSDRNRALVEGLGLPLTLRQIDDDVARFGLKPFSIWRASFREVLWLDCDCFPLRDPSFLFDDPEYQAKGSLFWRDVFGVDRCSVWHPSADVWPVFNVPPNDAEEFDTGQLLIDKERCWSELGLVVHFNRRSDVYYRHVWGDKDTFRLAWQNLAAARDGGRLKGYDNLADPDSVPFGFMPYGPFHMGRPNDQHKWGGGTVMVQRDRQGRALFNHRNTDKFKLDGDNVFNDDIENEAIYHQHLDALREMLAAG
jgi:alpha 1,2-mannosyltransferase